MKKKLTIGWKVSTLKLSLASLRYRAMLPVLALESRDIRSKIFRHVDKHSLDGLDVLVIVKSFTMADYWLTQQAALRGIPIVFDLCDNVFIERYKGKDWLSPAEVFLQIASLASAIVVTTQPLADAVRIRVGSGVPVHIIPDGIEDNALLAAIKRRLLLIRLRTAGGVLIDPSAWKSAARRLAGVGGSDRLRSLVYRRLPRGFSKLSRYVTLRYWLKLAYKIYSAGRSRLQPAHHERTPAPRCDALPRGVTAPRLMAEPDARKILWFGHHGAGHANFGMLDLLIIRDALERVAAELPVELVVVSNNLRKYEEHIAPLRIPSRYVEWSAEAMTQHLREASVVVIPNSRDEFSIGKSANRTVLALSQGIPVVATSTPALEPLRACIILDDFEQGLRRYLTDLGFARKQVSEGRMLIENLFGQDALAVAWGKVIDSVRATSRTRPAASDPSIIVAIQLAQDVDLAKPLLRWAAAKGIDCEVWASLSAVTHWPQVAHLVRSGEFRSRIVLDDLEDVRTEGFRGSVRALLTVTESNLAPHRFTHQLTKMANAANLFTATLQHGFENIGLTYSDDLHDIRKIQFASRRVYTWGELEALHPDIPAATREKCLQAGCPKPAVVEQANLDDVLPTARVRIGVFENLHWHRYSPEYREFFLEGVARLASLYPDVMFVVKPHSAGMWLTSRHKGARPAADNVFVIDPKIPQWTDVTAPQMFGVLDAVITTPSTVALDAARFGMPVAVVAADLHLANYAPLPLIAAVDDWASFAKQVLQVEHRELLIKRSADFAERAILSADAAESIFAEIMSYQKNEEARNA